ncbi:hypothetical protein DFH08DRAFT_1011763, partial [Mycena albidolilacea]
ASTALAVVVAAAATPGVLEWKLAPALLLRPLYPPPLPRGAVSSPVFIFASWDTQAHCCPAPGCAAHSACAKHIPGLNDVLYDALHPLRMCSPPAAVAISGLGEVPRDVLHMPHYAHARRWPPVHTLARRSRRCTDLVHHPRLALHLMALHTRTCPPPAAVALAQRRLACPHRTLHLCARRASPLLCPSQFRGVLPKRSACARRRMACCSTPYLASRTCVCPSYRVHVPAAVAVTQGTLAPPLIPHCVPACHVTGPLCLLHDFV